MVKLAVTMLMIVVDQLVEEDAFLVTVNLCAHNVNMVIFYIIPQKTLWNVLNVPIIVPLEKLMHKLIIKKYLNVHLV